eukprot:CAMPEP_0172589378 /NCGR_PEP_ID=MMETSP1068-20121228/8138_1 /TAXON_ID=35684 /ORGANISM="Pseudopedinella elastica, Strain CCMP716" /LENGTH=149 /DNA_ID=CAMNT_0013384971 /DNA_START=107 /DNA_END=556 /DNA_ORIENTATION=+
MKGAVLFLFLGSSAAFSLPPLPNVPSKKLTKVAWGNFGRPTEVPEPGSEGAAGQDEEKKPGITMQGLIELVMLGAGAPNLGKFTGVDKETGTLNFELEKNNFKSKKTGKTYNSFDNRDGTYFEGGYVDEDADIMGKFGKFFGGGKDKKA